MELYTIGFTRKSLREFVQLLQDSSVDGVVDIRLSNTSQLAGYAKRDDLAFPGLPPGIASVPCTDLKWRALGRRLLSSASQREEVTTLTLATDQLYATLGGPRAWWLVLGSTRAFHGRPWPLIVGVHTLPDYEATVDYSAL